MCIIRGYFKKTKIINYQKIEHGDEDEIIKTLSTLGPVSMMIDSNHKEIEFYKTGIINFEKCSRTHLDHAVLAVGYDLTGKIPFLIVKNR